MTCADVNYEADIISPFLWAPTEDFSGGQYSFQLQDESGESPATSSPFSVKSEGAITTEHSLPPSLTVCRYVKEALYPAANAERFRI